MATRGLLRLMVPLMICVGLVVRTDAAGLSGDERAAAAAAAPVASAAPAQTPQRPSALVPLYVSFATLQGLDIHSTLRAVEAGGREANPIVGSMLGSPAAFVAVKAGMTAGICVASERLWKRNRAAAIVTMIVLNATYSAVVAHNYAIESRAAPRR
jgi:Domain of unknown function (DUF5658)